jgi:mRNA interferase RelE/StbE
MDDRAGLQAAMDAADALADDPDPPGSVRWGGTEWRRLRAGRYRILYSVEGDLVTIMRIDRITG